MMRRGLIMTLTALPLAGVLYLGCTKDPKQEPSAIAATDIVGRWKNKNGKLVMEFHDDGLYCVPQSFTACNLTAMKLNDQWWRVQDGRLVWKEMESVTSSRRVAQVTRYTGSELHLTLDNGRTLVFVRQ